MRRAKVLLFIITDFARSDGAVLWAANLLECLARVPNIDFIIVSSGPDNVRSANQEFISSLGFDHFFVPFRQISTPGSNTRLGRLTTIAGRVLTIALEKYYFLLERDARKQKHVDSEVMGIIREKRPDLIIVNGRNAALHVRSAFSLATPCCFITLDNEIAYQRLYRSQSGPTGEAMSRKLERWICRHGNWIANRRFRRYIDWLYKQCAGVVALSRNDLPTDLPEHVVRAVIPPLLKTSDRQWNYKGSRCLLFVGNINVVKIVHVANRLAIEWICSQLAPELSRIDETVRIVIIGANTEQVPASWQRSNIDFMGRADKGELIRQMTTADLFIAPIANKLGAKLKLAECVAHGMPFLATDAAMSGLPFLTSIPRIELEQPGAAARLVVEYMNKPDELTNLSQSITAQAQQARTEQDMAWMTFLKHSMGAPQEGDRSMRTLSSAATDDCEAM